MKRNRLFVTLVLAAAVVSSYARAQAIFTTAPDSLMGFSPTRAAPSAPPREPSPVDAPEIVAPAPVSAVAPRAPAPASAPEPNIAAPASAPQPPPPPAPATAAVLARTPTTTGGAGGAATAVSTDMLRHLTNTIQGFRLAGEIGTVEWPAYLTEAQVKSKLRFRIGYLSAISVMPEASFLKLTINDQLIAKAHIMATQGVRTIDFDIPDGALQPGFNSIRITAEHRHRVDCSLAATYELWTQIDPAQTGFVIPSANFSVAKVADLAALSPDARGALPIRAVLPAHSTIGNVERIMRATQMISLVGRFEQPIVDVGPMTDGPYGINLVIGVVSEIAPLVGASPALYGGPRVVVMPATALRRTTLIVTGGTDAEVTAALNQIQTGADVRGSPAGLRAASAFPGYRIDGGERVKLSELGAASQEFGGRMFRIGFNLLMPPDFYSADYAKANLDLAGAYSAGLTDDAQIIVSVNGRNVTSIKMPKTAGDVYSHNPIPLPLGSMRPGLNRIEIEAQLPMFSDLSCDPRHALGGDKRFLFLDSTVIEIPSVARIARSPDLAVTASGGFPFFDGEKQPRLVVPSPDKETIGAAATLVAQLAIAAGRVINFQLDSVAPPPGSGATLIVGALDALDDSLVRAMDLPRDELVAAWPAADPADRGGSRLSKNEEAARNLLSLTRNFPASCQMARPPQGFARLMFGLDRTDVGSIGQEEGGRNLYSQWNDRVKGEGWRRLRRAYTDARHWAAERYQSVVSIVTHRFDASDATKPAWRRVSLVVAQSSFGSSRDNVVTLVTGPSAGALADASACLVDPRVWRDVRGRVSALDMSEASVRSIASKQPRFIVTEPLSLGNLRLITAGWLSLNAAAYVGVAFVVAALLALATTAFVSNVGRRQE